MLLEKGGDLEGGAKYRAVAQARRQPEPSQPLQDQVNLAHSKLRLVEKQLSAALTKYDEHAETLSRQRESVASFRAESQLSEDNHRSLMGKLAKEHAPRGIVIPVQDLLDGKLEDAITIDVGFLSIDELEHEISQQDREELDKRTKALSAGVQKMCKDLFLQASEETKKIREEHNLHVERIAAKRRRRQESPPASGGGAAASAPAGGEPPPAAAAGSGATDANQAVSRSESDQSLASLKARADAAIEDPAGVAPPAREEA